MLPYNDLIESNELNSVVNKTPKTRSNPCLSVRHFITLIKLLILYLCSILSRNL